MKKGFTLSEVLITLGVIGVVASLTMPALIQHYRKQVVETKLQKFYSLMSQAIKMSEIDNDDISGWVKAEIKYLEDGTKDWDANFINTEQFFDKYISPYVKTIKKYNREFDFGGTAGKQNLTTYVLADGSLISLNNGNCVDFKYDINGDTAPNEMGRDTFNFLLCINKDIAKGYCGAENKHFCPHGDNSIKTREQILKKCRTDARFCSWLIEVDGWKIKDDYPHKL